VRQRTDMHTRVGDMAKTNPYKSTWLRTVYDVGFEDARHGRPALSARDMSPAYHTAYVRGYKAGAESTEPRAKARG